MYLQDQEFQQLHAVFEYLVTSPYALNGSWPSGPSRLAPRFIRRGPMLLMGRGGFEELYILNPGDAVVTPVTDSQGASAPFPRIDGGQAVRVTGVDGPWWDLLRQELAEMVREVQMHQRARQGVREKHDEKEVEKLQQAADVVSAFLKKPGT